MTAISHGEMLLSAAEYPAGNMYADKLSLPDIYQRYKAQERNDLPVSL